jgi:uncharacterized protein (DUF1684 family)
MALSLLDWRRRVAHMWDEARLASHRDPEGALATFRVAKDDLFRSHPDSPIPTAQRSEFERLPYWPYDADHRFTVPVEPREPTETSASSIAGDSFALRRIGVVELPFGQLEVYWIDVYGGGIFIPFRDATSGSETYGAGRYLLDTIKGADLGGDADGLVLDFNYAYHPSCVYDPKWSCPLAPRANWLDDAIRAGERLE